MIPISDLKGLISLQVALFMKTGSWSFNVMNASRLAELSMRSCSESSWAIFLSVEVMLLVMLVRLFVCTVIFKEL